MRDGGQPKGLGRAYLVQVTMAPVVHGWGPGNDFSAGIQKQTLVASSAGTPHGGTKNVTLIKHCQRVPAPLRDS